MAGNLIEVPKKSELSKTRTVIVYGLFYEFLI